MLLRIQGVLASDVVSPIESVPHCLGGYAFEEFIEGIPGLRCPAGGLARHADQSRNNSLMLVFARVPASTRLTITAQASEAPGEPSGKDLPCNAPETTTE